MKLLKPHWVNHNGCAIYSLDIHPDKTRLVTGGLGNDCGKVVIWSMGPIADEDKEKDEAVQKQICQMDNHLSCVNCVRWSYSGEFLASGSDDKLVIVWKQHLTTTREGQRHEQWKIQHMLRGHTGDVLDVAWSPHDVYLASCSVDNSIVIWNALKFPEIVHIIREHTGLVKGVTWDPTGKYLASQSDDKTLKIWQTMNHWKLETTIAKPFKECGGTTHVLRLGWSPDGHYIVSAHAMNNAGPTAQIIERAGWKTQMDFVGHRKAITCVRFNPNILVKKINKNSHKPQQYSACALGSKDKSISIWMTALKRPLVVVHALFNQAIMDLTWSSDGKVLMACSLDGTVAYLEFDADEIGRPISKDDKLNMQKKIYGKEYDLLNPKRLSTANAKLADYNNDHVGVASNQDRKGYTQSIIHKSPIIKRDRQLEYRLPNGKRRITPIYIANTKDIIIENVFMSTVAKNSDIKVEKRAFLASSNLNQTKGLLSSSSSLSIPRHNKSNLDHDVSTCIITPSHPRISRRYCDNDVEMGFENSYAIDSPCLPTINASKQAYLPNRKSSIPDYHESHIIHITNPQRCSFAVEIKNLSLSPSGEPNGRQTQENGYVTIVQAQPIISSKNKPISREKPATNNGKIPTPNWRNVFTYSPVNMVSYNNHALALSLPKLPGLLFLSLTTGRFLTPPIAISSPATYLHGKSDHVLLITANDTLCVWHTNLSYLNPIECIINDISLSPLPNTSNSDIKLKDIDIDPVGNPILKFSNNDKYTYDLELKNWIIVEKGDDIFQTFYQTIYLNHQLDTGENNIMKDSQNLICRTSNSTATDSLVPIQIERIEKIANLLQNPVFESCLSSEQTSAFSSSSSHLLRFYQSKILQATIAMTPTTPVDNSCNTIELAHWFDTLIKYVCTMGLKGELHDIIQGLAFVNEKAVPQAQQTLNGKLLAIVKQNLDAYGADFKTFLHMYHDILANT